MSDNPKINDFVNGKTTVLGLIGNPVEHTFSPQIHNTIAKMLGVNTVYAPFLVENDNVKAAIKGARALNIAGLNVTVPHKKSVMPFLAAFDPTAEKIGAVNTLKLTKDGYVGYNTDIIGIINTFKARNYLPDGKVAGIIGAGGSANAAGFALAEMGIKKIFIFNRTINLAKTLANSIKKHYDIDVCAKPLNDMVSLSKTDVIFQATSVGMKGEESPVSLNGEAFTSAEFVFDAIYSPWETAFLKAAKKECPICVNGFEMLVYQAAASFEIFSGVSVDTGDLLKILEKCYR